MPNLGKTVERSFYFNASPEIRENAKLLRLEMTASEQILWQALRNRKLGGFLFRRQHPIFRFVADFYCHQARLVVELDGKIHEEPDHQASDMNRTAELERFGLRVIRFTNDEVEKELHHVIRRIKEELEKST